ncbi:ATP-dependent DNA helicase DinG [Salinispirillum sp. LH 10-3-1]|uniref:ATP-dependent DNA helicase DinG n=1 Tax=Salinispirillum sp. LH 10-3-1 TaxID=2952525 RepID=A0AB38YBI6_9GAMM
MLTEQQKNDIQQAYRDYLKARDLKPRTGQRQMIAHIARQVGAATLQPDAQRIAVVEAGTGTGKTLAYLIPALVLAQTLKKQIVLSTATVALQSQLIEKDLPDVLASTSLEFDFALGKGRGRFFCEVNAEQAKNELATEANLFTQGGARTEQTMDTLTQLMQRFQTGDWNGDIDALEAQPDFALRKAITATGSECLGALCSRYDGCPYFANRQRLKEADVLVVNHDLVLSDMALGGGVVLPDPKDVIFIFDEAHHLPDKALNHFSMRLELTAFQRYIDGIGRHATKMVSELAAYDQLGTELGEMEFQGKEAKQKLKHIAMLLDDAWVTTEVRDGSRMQWHRFELGAVPETLKVALVELTQTLRPIQTFLNNAHKHVNSQLRAQHPPTDVNLLQTWAQQIAQDLELVSSATALSEQYQKSDADTPMAYWLERDPQDNELALMASPFLAGGVLNVYLWQRAYAAVMTSATLSAGGDFSRFKAHAGVYEDELFLRVASPFNYPEQGELLLPLDAVSGGQQAAHTQYVVDKLPSLLLDHQATLVLFSSRVQMNEVYERLPVDWQNRIQAQGVSSKEHILREHARLLADGSASVIFGLASFSEGVDLPGDALTQVIVAKLPFSVPDDPLQSAAAEWTEKRGGNPFMQLTLPEAIIRLTQAVGRLIRNERDHGRVVLLDGRVRTARYGSLIVQALPPFRRAQ